MVLGEKIKLLREQCQLTQEQLADLIGVKKASISAYENGTTMPRLDHLIRLTHILSTTADYLLYRDAPPVIELSGLNESQIALVRHTVDELKRSNHS